MSELKLLLGLPRRLRDPPAGSFIQVSPIMRTFFLLTGFLAGLLPLLGADEPLAALKLEITDARGNALPCRVHLLDGAGKSHQPPGLPFWRDHFVCTGRVALKLPPGTYTYEIERGPEHERRQGKIDLKAGAEQTAKVQLGRVADLAAGGWYSGDLHVHRPVKDIELLMQAEDLNIAPVITWWNTRNEWAKDAPPRPTLMKFDRNRYYDVMAGEDERGGGALLFFHLEVPLAITQAKREHPSALRFVEQARRLNPNVWIDLEKPFWWDAPAWLASGHVNSIGIANNHMCRSQMYLNEAWGRPRDERRLPNPLGNGHWTQEIYYHVLNCGLRIPPSAGSASGVLPNPVGYNRVYVQLEGPLEYEPWWAGLKAGRSFVSNGPLLLSKANGHLPGHVFRGEAGKPLAIKVEFTLTSQDATPKLELIKNGQIESTVVLGKETTRQGSTHIEFRESGWFLVRALTDAPNTFRFASTAPFYVELGEQNQRISKRSARFFVDWVSERIARLEKTELTPGERREVLETQEKAKHFWQELADKATAE